MPGHTSPYWTAVDFDSEGDDDPSPESSQRVYIDPWDAEPYSTPKTERADSQPETLPSMAGEPVSASFYYVPTKSYDSEEDEGALVQAAAEEMAAAAAYQRRRSRQHHHHEPHQHVYNNFGYDFVPMHERRRSIYNGDEYYGHQQLMYDPLYRPPPPGLLPPPALPPPGMFLPTHVRKRVSLPAPPHPDLLVASRNGKHRRSSRYGEMCDRYAYESLMSEYGALGPAALEPEDWTRRAVPKAAPDNFHLSRYGHLKIDYSCSWTSLDRLIRNQ